MKDFVNKFTNRWGKLKQVHLPCSIIHNDVLSLDPCALKALTVLHHIHKNTKRFQGVDELRAIAKIGQRRLMERTGYARRTISRAVKSLYESGYVEMIADRKGPKKNGSGAARYILLRPDIRLPLIKSTEGSVLLANKLPYFTVPVCIITNSEQDWSLAQMSSSETALYFSALYLANRVRSNEYNISVSKLRVLSGLSRSTYNKAAERLQEMGLIQSFEQKELTITICDPHTGEPLHIPNGTEEDDPANYYDTNVKGISKRLILNTGSPHQLSTLICSAIPEGQPVREQSNGDLMIRCPFHHDETPSCSVSPSKRCFQCFGCGKTGTVTTLIAALTDTSRANVILRTAEFIGKNAEFHQPDSTAIAIYKYRDANGKLLKEVLRYPDDPKGNKVINQRRPTSGGFVWNTMGLPPMLFNRELQELGSSVVFLTEGEKDATTITNLWKSGKLNGIAMTSGGAASWDASLARLLVGKRVIVLPDSDSPGTKYAQEVATSLEREGIQYRVVDFAPTGAKDATEYLQKHSLSEFARLAGIDWVGPSSSEFDGLVEISEPTII